MKNKETLFWTCALLTSLVAGCAVLTVDVDVYKGPLANHKDVQTEQMAAMAIGAKPLLVELRDTLEVLYYAEEAEKKLEYPRSPEDLKNLIVGQLHNEPWYKPEYVEPEWNVKRMKSRFRDPDADNVNNILYLYKDRQPSPYMELLERAQRAFLAYEKAYDLLRPGNMEEDKALALKIDPTITSKDRKKEKDEPSLLKQAYAAFLYCSERAALDIMKASDNWEWTNQVNDENKKSVEQLKKHPLWEDRNVVQNVSNAAFHALAETELVDLQVKYLLGLTDKREQQKVIRRVRQISRAFLTARKALEELWRVSMEMIIYINRRPLTADETNKERRQLTAKVVTFALEVIQPKHVALLAEELKEKDLPEDATAFRDAFCDYVNAHGTRSFKKLSYYEDAKKALADLLNAQPIFYAAKLLDGHEYSKTVFVPVTDKPDSSLDYKEGWEFGLARGPTEPDFNPNALLKGYTKAFKGEGGALGGGRLAKGLETLIEEYLNAAAECDTDSDKGECPRQVLAYALMRFAEKLLFVANNEILMTDPTRNEQGLIRDLGDAASRSLFGLKSPDFTIVSTRVLQAVGNSILVQADALHQESKHRERLEDHYKKEAAILADTLDRLSPVNRDNTGITHVKKTLCECTTAKDVRDVWIELLEYEHDLALYYGDAQRAKKIAKALEAARKKREGMIFLRPAMAYLRTSFPATSLQDNPNLTWDNMLGGHMIRSIPFAPRIGEFLNPDAKRDARITAEIDKQFWQNINRVRVAGGGFTSYAVVKDDIGNWYVKGYKADPKDIIEAGKSALTYAAVAKKPGGFLGIGGKADDTQQVQPASLALEPVFDKYQEEYRRKTQQDYDRLYKFLKKGVTGVDGQISNLWEANTETKKIRSGLKKALDSSYDNFLEPVFSKLDKDEKAIDKQREMIIEGIKALRQFKDDLNRKIKYVDAEANEPPAPKVKPETKEPPAPKAEAPTDPNVGIEANKTPTPKIDGVTKNSPNTNVTNNQTKNEQPEAANKRAFQTAMGIVTNVIESQINALLVNRKDSIKTYEKALVFLAEAMQPQEK